MSCSISLDERSGSSSRACELRIRSAMVCSFGWMAVVFQLPLCDGKYAQQFQYVRGSVPLLEVPH